MVMVYSIYVLSMIHLEHFRRHKQYMYNETLKILVLFPAWSGINVLKMALEQNVLQDEQSQKVMQFSFFVS